MKKFTKLLAVLLAIAVIVCPMVSALSVSADATPSGTYKLEQVDGDTVRLTINSTDGFLVYKAVITTNGTLSNIAVADYTLKTGTKDGYNLPAVSANTAGNATTILVSATDGATLDLYTQVVVTMDVTTGSNVAITNIQAADDGEIADDPTLLDFPGVANSSNGDIDTGSQAYEEAAVVENVHNHVATTTVAAAAATCSATGTQGYVYCATCEKYFTDNTFATETTVAAREIAIDANAHVWGEYVSDGNATCTEDGTMTRVCAYDSAHKDTVTDTDSKLGHSFTSKPSTTVETPATCTTAAKVYVQCDRCTEITHDMTVSSGDPLGHTMTSHAANAATCTADGNSAYWSCNRCDKFFSDAQGNTEIAENSWVISSTGHTATDTKTFVKDEATCKDDAVYYQECSVCHVQLDTTWTDTGSHLNVEHTYGAYTHVVGSETCTGDGQKSRTCSTCGDVDTVAEDGNYKLGHAFNSKDSGIEAAPATCLAAATHKVQCDRCDVVSDTVTVPVGEALSHNYVWDGVEGNGQHTVVCLNGCEDSKLEACDTTGTGGACSVCGYKAAPAIPVDPNLDKLGATIGVDPDALKITFRIKTTNFNAYDNVQLSITAGKYNVTTFNETDPNVVTVNKSEMTVAGSYTTFVYKEFMLYELGLGFSYQLKGYKGGECVATSTLVETTVVDIVKDWVITDGAQSAKTIGTDIINLGEAAKIQFGNTKVGSDLYNAPSLIGSFDMSNATVDVPALTNVLNHVVENDSGFDSSLVLPSVAVDKVPVLTLRVGSKANPYNDPSKFAMNVAFTDPINGPQNYTVPSDGFVAGGTRYVNGTFAQLPLYASNATVTITLRYQGSKVATITYSLDSYYYEMLSKGSAPLEAALAKLGASARAQFVK